MSDPFRLPDTHAARVPIASESDESTGLDASFYAMHSCPYCKGSGYVAVEDGGAMPREDLCACVLEGRRRAAVDVAITERFGEGGREMTFARFQTGGDPMNETALKACQNYVKKFSAMRGEGVGFALVGPPETGKTHLANATLIMLLKMWKRPDGEMLNTFSLSVPELLRRTKQRWDDKTMTDAIEQAMRADVLVLNDIGAEYHRAAGQDTSWVDEQLFLILDHRLENKLPTIFTTNLKKTELEQGALHPRVVRRLGTKTLAWLPVKKVQGAVGPDPQLRSMLLG